MGKASRDKREADRRQKIAAQRAAARRAQARRRVLIAVGSVLAVLAIVITFVVVKVESKPGTAPVASNGPTGAALASVVRDVTTIPASVLDQVGAGQISRSSIGAVNPQGAPRS